MIIDDIINEIKNVKIHNSFYFIHNRYYYITSEENRGYVKIYMKNPQEFYEYLKKIESGEHNSYIPNCMTTFVTNAKRMSKDLKYAVDTYNPSEQFVLYIKAELDEKTSHETFAIIDKKYQRKVFYGKSQLEENYTDDDYFEKIEFFEEIPCISCKNYNEKILLSNEDESLKMSCKCCDKKQTPKIVLECIVCFAQYMYS